MTGDILMKLTTHSTSVSSAGLIDRVGAVNPSVSFECRWPIPHVPLRPFGTLALGTSVSSSSEEAAGFFRLATTAAEVFVLFAGFTVEEDPDVFQGRLRAIGAVLIVDNCRCFAEVVVVVAVVAV